MTVPIYYSLTGSEDFLLDSFQDDVVGTQRFVELNTDQIPRAHVTLSSWSVKGEEFANPNVWLKVITENEFEIKKQLTRIRALPIKANYEMVIKMDSEIDTFKASQAIMKNLMFYKYCYFEYQFMNIDCIIQMPNDQTVKIQREKSLSSDNTVDMTLSLEVHTYYPAYTDTQVLGRPKGVIWANQIMTGKK